MHVRIFAAIALVAAPLSLSTAALAAAPLPPQPPNAALEPMHTVHVSEEVSYLSGGVGEAERAVLHKRRRQFSLYLCFASQKNGAFLSYVDVTLTGHGQRVPAVNLTTAGPLLLVDLPAGNYTLTASAPGWQKAEGQIHVRTGPVERIYVTLEPERD